MRLLLSLAVVAGLAGCGGREAGPLRAVGASPRGSDASAASAPESDDAGSDATDSGFALADFDAADALAQTTGADAAMQTSAVVYCSGVEDCEASPLFFPSGATCCVANACIFGNEVANSSCGEPDAQVIVASNYDLSCTSDLDCALVPVGDFCYPGANNCSLGAISQRALPQYQSDVSQTYAARCFAAGNCPATSVCCRNGQCQSDNCVLEVDTLPACANAGGVCRPTGTGGVRSACTVNGPPDSCAYPDETCCLGDLPCPGIASFSITPAELLSPQQSTVSITTVGHVSSIGWAASSCHNYPSGLYPASGQIGGFADPSSASTTFNCGTCTGQVAITATIASDQVEPGSDAATNACLGAPFTTFTGQVNCQLSGALRCPDAAETDLCFGACTSLKVDRNNCGACGNVCGPGSSCNSGVCNP